MGFREFIAEKRLVSVVAAPTALGVVAVAVAGWALFATPPQQTEPVQLTSSVTECHDMVTISVAGRGDTPVAGTTKMLLDANGKPLPAALSGDHKSQWVDPVVNAPANATAPGKYAAIYIAYPANLNTYENAVNSGVANAQRVMHDIAQACPNTKFSIVGYSEGADVARRLAMDVGHSKPGADGKYAVVNPANVVGVVILADAGRTAGMGPFPGAKDPTRPDNFDRPYQNGTKAPAGQGALPGTAGDFGALNGKVASFCSDGDLTCAAPQNISLLQLAVNVGRQLNADELQKDGLTPGNAQGVAVVLGKVALAAFADIAAQPNWMAGDETFLQVLLRVSDPAYRPGQTPKPVGKPETIAAENMSPLAYLPKKVFNEIVGLIVTNQNTIPVVMNDPYNLTLGPGTGHHFDYWRDKNPADGRNLTSAEYAAAWLTHLAQQAQSGQQVDTKSKPTTDDVNAAFAAAKAVQAPPTLSPAEPAAKKVAAQTSPATTKQVETTGSTAAPKPAATTPAPSASRPAESTTSAASPATSAAPAVPAAPKPVQTPTQIPVTTAPPVAATTVPRQTVKPAAPATTTVSAPTPVKVN